MSAEFPPCPTTLKQIQHFLKTAQEHDGRDLIVAYWCRLYALQTGLKMSTHQPDETKMLLALMDWLENTKKQYHDNESITNEVAAQAHLENYALKLFLYADKQDRESNFGKNVVKAFYTSGVIYDVLQTFGELTDEAVQNRKYAKWKAAYIHNCLKNGEQPMPGPMVEEGDEEESGAAGGEPAPTPPQDPSPSQMGPSSSQGWTPPSEPQAPPSNITADEVLENPDILPKPPVDEEKNPGGFIPFVPQSSRVPIPTTYNTAPTDIRLTPAQMIKAQKYCKYAGSALNFDDISTAVENLQKALTLLTTGHE